MYQSRILPANTETSFLFSRLLYEKHIYYALDDEMRDAWGVHRVLTEIETGSRIVLGVFNKADDSFCGCIHGLFETPEFHGHFMFKRKVNAVEAVLECEKVCETFYREKNAELKYYSNLVPVNNRAVCITAKKLGHKDMGIVDGEFFYSFGKKIPCKKFMKEVK